jgi:hypothetical protein
MSKEIVTPSDSSQERREMKVGRLLQVDNSRKPEVL